MSIEKDVFGVELKKDDIFAKIAFEKILAREGETIVLVEGSQDKELLKGLFMRYKKKVYLIPANGKLNALEYYNFDKSVFCILDRDFEKNKKYDKVIYTYYANLEADILNYENIEELLKSENSLKKYRNHIMSLENLKKGMYRGKYKWGEIRNETKIYKEKWLKVETIADFLKMQLFKKNINQKNKYFDYERENGIHCAKEIVRILFFFKKDKVNDYSYFLKSLAFKISDENPLIKKIILNNIFFKNLD